MDHVSAHVCISGRVQGVGFRYYTRQQARVLKVVGWVKNLPDGRVEAVFEGEKGSVNDMIAWCWDASPTASVQNVAVSWQDPQKHASFEIKR